MTHRQRISGFTLIELMIVMAVLVIVAAMASFGFSDQIRRNRFQSDVTDVVAVFELAKSEAFRRLNVTTTITIPPTTSDWTVSTEVKDASNVVKERRTASSRAGLTMVAQTESAPPNTLTLGQNFRGIVTGAFISTANCATAADKCLLLQHPADSQLQLRVGINALGQVSTCTPAKSFGSYKAC